MIQAITYFVIFIALLLISQINGGTIVSNLPVAVTSNKSFTSANPTWITSPFFRAGNEKVINVLTGSNLNPQYTFTFSSALPGVPNLAYGIKNYKGNDWFGQQFYEIKQVGLTPSTFRVSIQIYGVTNLWILCVAYLAADPTFPHHLNTFDNVPVNYSNGDIVNITTMQTYQTFYSNTINYTAQAAGRAFNKFTTPYDRNNIVLFMTSLWIRASFGSGSTKYPISLRIYPYIINETHYYWNLTLRVKVLVTNCHFSQVIFNSDDVESSKKYFIIYNKWYNDINGGFLQVPQQFVDNFIMAVTCFETVDGYCGFQYNWEFTNKTVGGVTKFGVELQYSWTKKNTCGFSWSQTSILYLQTWLCSPPYYYFNLTSGLCQTLCGGYYVQNQADFTCQACTNTQCYQCTDPTTNLCLQCATFKNYTLFNSTCICIPNHIQIKAACQPCSYGSAHCLTCTYNDGANGTLNYNSALFTCLTCNESANYFISGRFCTVCTMSNCLLCDNLTACQTCASTWNLSIIFTCIKCTVTGCQYCSATDGSKCAVCNEQGGYYINSSLKCVAKCGDGISVSGFEGCDDGNLANFDGCSSTCNVESFFSCSSATLSVCSFQSSVSVVLNNSIMETLVCNTLTLIFKITPVSNTFSQNYIQWNSFLTTPNSSLLYANTTMTRYSSGFIYYSYSLNKTLQGLPLTFQTNFNSLITDSSIFATTTSPDITFTVLPTSTKKAYFQCCSGFQFLDETNSSCIEICGDGILFIRECDDGNLLNGDGCNNLCKMQTDYTCVNGSNITASVCGFNGTIFLDLYYGQKSATSNQLTLKYKISPIDPILDQINGTYDFKPYLSYPLNPQINILSAQYDPVLQEFIVNLEYTASIQDQTLELRFQIPQTPTSFSFPQVSHRWEINLVNHLSPTYYDQSVYDRVTLLEPFFKAFLGIFLGVFVLTICFKKYLGLQLAIFMQITYLSILFSHDLRPEYQNLTLWQYIFGYNYFYMTPITHAVIDQSYYVFGYTKFFGHSNNLMVVATASIYTLGLLFYALSAVTIKTASRRMKAFGDTLTNDIGFTMVLFTTPNILTAVCIQIKQNTILDTSLVWSKALLVVALTLYATGNILNCLNLSTNLQVGSFYRKHSNFGLYAPIFFPIKCTLLPILIFLSTIFKLQSIAAILVVQILYFVFVAFGRPHKKMIDFVRALILQGGLLFVLADKYLYTYIFDISLPNTNILYQILFLCQVAFIAGSLVTTAISFLYHVCHRKKQQVNPETQVNQQPELQASPQMPIQQFDRSNNKPNHKPEIPYKEIEDMSASLQKLDQMSPSKRQLGSEKSNEYIFDVDDIQTGTGNNSRFNFDTKRKQKKLKKSRWQ